MKNYYTHLDELKGLAILLMVMAHAIAWSYPDYTFLGNDLSSMSKEVFNATILHKVIYSFHMPLLFFVSGFLFYKKDDDWTLKFVKVKLTKRFERLLIPYLFTGFFIVYLRGYFGYWFLIVLFVLNSLVICEMYILNKVKISLSREIIYHSSFFIILYFSAKYYSGYLVQPLANLSFLPNYYLVFILGFMIHKYSKIELFALKPTISLLCLLLYTFLMVSINYYGHFRKFALFIPVFAILFLYSSFINKNSSILSTVGKNSLEIYIFHVFFIVPFQEVGSYLLNISSLPISVTLQLVYSLLLSVIAIGFSLIVSWVIKSNQILSKLILGK